MAAPAVNILLSKASAAGVDALLSLIGDKKGVDDDMYNLLSLRER